MRDILFSNVMFSTTNAAFLTSWPCIIVADITDVSTELRQKLLLNILINSGLDQIGF